MSKYIIYTDGGARDNPGPAGAGVVVKDEQGNILKKAHKVLGSQTNNYAEYAAVIFAFEVLKRMIKRNERKDAEIEVRLDSELVASQLSEKYEIKEKTLFPLFIKIHNLRITHFPKVTFTHISREENKEADALSNEAMDEQSSTQGTLL